MTMMAPRTPPSMAQPEALLRVDVAKVVQVTGVIVYSVVAFWGVEVAKVVKVTGAVVA